MQMVVVVRGIVAGQRGRTFATHKGPLQHCMRAGGSLVTEGRTRLALLLPLHDVVQHLLDRVDLFLRKSRELNFTVVVFHASNLGARSQQVVQLAAVDFKEGDENDWTPGFGHRKQLLGRKLDRARTWVLARRIRLAKHRVRLAT
jgi:hypothetical protein